MSLDLKRYLSVPVFGLSLLVLSCTATSEENSPNPSKAQAKSETQSPSKTSPGENPTGNHSRESGNQGLGTLSAQQKNFLIENALKKARRLMADNRYEEAKLAAMKALELDRDRPETRKVYNEILTLLGERQGDLITYGEHMRKLAELRIQKDIGEAHQLISQAKQDMRDGKYEEAIRKLKKVELRVEIGSNINWKDIPKTAEALLKKAEAAQESALLKAQENAQRQAFAQRRRQEELERQRRKARTDFHLAKGTKAFENHDYRSALEHAEEALRIDPLSRVGRDLYSVSEKALRNAAQDSYLVEKARAFKKFQEANEEKKIPYTDILVKPTPEYWNKISKIRAEDSSSKTQKDPDNLALEKKLSELRVPKGAEFTDESGGYAEVASYLAKVTGLPILVTPEAQEVIDSNELVLTMKLESPLSVRNFLNLMSTRSKGEIAWTIEDGAVLLTTKAKAMGKPTLKVHKIQDLTFGLADFAGPQIKDIPIVGEEAPEDQPRQGGQIGDPVKMIDPEVLASLVQKAVAPGTWENEGVSIEATDANLIVTHTPEVQEQVSRFLDDLRKFTSSMVNIESRFLRVDRNWLQQFGVDFRGLGGANAKGRVVTLDDVTNGLDDNASRGLDNNGTGGVNSHPVSGFFYDDGLDGDFRGRTENFFQNSLGRLLTTNGGATFGFTLLDDSQLNLLARAVEKKTNVQIVDSQILTVLNGQRGYISVINQTTYIQDFTVEVAQAAFIADPEVNVVQDGVVLDVRPSISYDRKHITLDLQPTVAELTRPIPTFTTALAGTTLPVTIQFPQLTVRSMATTVKVPDGGSVLIGGLNEVLNRERRAEVPWLAQLPLVSFLFKEEGVVDENSSLMVLVKAFIVNSQEIMAQKGR